MVLPGAVLTLGRRYTHLPDFLSWCSSHLAVTFGVGARHTLQTFFELVLVTPAVTFGVGARHTLQTF